MLATIWLKHPGYKIGHGVQLSTSTCGLHGVLLQKVAHALLYTHVDLLVCKLITDTSLSGTNLVGSRAGPILDLPYKVFLRAYH